MFCLSQTHQWNTLGKGKKQVCFPCLYSWVIICKGFHWSFRGKQNCFKKHNWNGMLAFTPWQGKKMHKYLTTLFPLFLHQYFSSTGAAEGIVFKIAYNESLNLQASKIKCKTKPKVIHNSCETGLLPVRADISCVIQIINSFKQKEKH